MARRSPVKPSPSPGALSARADKAKIDDALQIHKMVNYFADKGEMLHRPLSEIYENIRDFYVARDGDRVLACAALHVMWADLAEVKSVAVSEELQSSGLGSLVTQACIDEAKELGIATVFCLTYRPGFFEQFGFRRVNLMTLSRKVWGECYRCPKFPDCDEIAMTLHLKPPAETALGEPPLLNNGSMPLFPQIGNPRPKEV